MAWVNTVGQYWTNQQKYQNLSYSMINHKNTIGYCFCPTLTCNEDLGTRICYQHSGTSPVTYIKTDPCPYQNQICDIGDDKNMAWVNTVGQYWTNQQKYQNLSYSMINHKNTIGYCKSTLSFQKGLNSGRRCLYNHQCNSLKCDNGICRGKSQGQNCGKHEECDIQNACRRDVSWPFETKCRAYAVTGDTCDSDYDCDPLNFCSYESATTRISGIKKCLSKYSQNSGVAFGWQDYSVATTTAELALLNGQYCKSGWAYQNSNTAVCFTHKFIKAKNSDNLLTSPYSCNPSQKINTFDPLDNVNACRYFFTDKSYVEDECSCSMQGGSIGYCRWPGINETSEYITSMIKLWTSTRCHTLDRNNLQAQAECGIGSSLFSTQQISMTNLNNEFVKIVDNNLKFNNWPLYQNKQGFDCWSSVYPNSLEGIINYTQISTNQTNYVWRGIHLTSMGFYSLQKIYFIMIVVTYSLI
eukprot:403333281